MPITIAEEAPPFDLSHPPETLQACDEQMAYCVEAVQRLQKLALSRSYWSLGKAGRRELKAKAKNLRTWAFALRRRRKELEAAIGPPAGGR